MIIVTQNGGRPLVGNVRGIRVLTYDSKSVADILYDVSVKNFKNPTETEGFLFVAPGGRVNTALLWPLVNRNDFDVAAHVDRIGKVPAEPWSFDGIGRVLLDTVFVKPTTLATRAMARWFERIRAGAGKDAINLAIVLKEMPDLRFLCLKRSWVWREEMRPHDLHAEPVVDFTPQSRRKKEPKAKAPKIEQLTTDAVKPTETAKELPPGVLWVGHLYQYTGYGKANREILFRLANSMSVRIDDTHKEPVYVREDLRARLDVHKNVVVSPRAPLLRMMGPDHISSNERHRIVWTMQETSVRVHDDMVKRANENFDEIWTPTAWNARVFRDSGMRPPIRVMPLGIDPVVFRRVGGHEFPRCRLISTSRRGITASPKGFIFLTIGLPGFRKGWDVVADAMELAFRGKKSINFVIGLTHSPPAWNEKVYKQFARYKVPIWTLEGSFDENELAKIYSSSDAYVSASRGEGFNLPAAEAAACGVPVIVPENTCHPDIFSGTYMFKPDGEQKYPEGDWISIWYRGQLFSKFGAPAIRRLAALLELVHRGNRDVTNRTAALQWKIRNTFTWDNAARGAAERLMEVQP